MRVLETKQRLSESILWTLQREAYCQFGIDAWNQHGVPSYITSNSYIAKAYAHVVLGYLRDCIAQSLIDTTHPLYILDLGAGTGRFAYLFLKELLAFLDSSSLPKINICYVMTDIVESNLDFWQQHPLLKPYFDSGVLDKAYYHHAQKTPIHLINRHETLSQETVINPLILICNYFFDTIPQDLFRFTEGKLEEGRITLSVRSSSLNEVVPTDPSLINQLSYAYAYEPLRDVKNYYPTQALNTLLESYCETSEGYPFLFPIGAFQALETFMQISQSRLCLLAGDQGICTLEQLRQSGEPKISLHGSFSVPVNYQIVSSFFLQQRGTVSMTSFSDPTFVIMAGVIGTERAPETALAFQEHVDSFEPTDYFKLVLLAENKWKDPSLDYLLLLIKLGNWDASVLLAFFSAIRQTLTVATDTQKELLCATIDHVYEHFYPTEPASGDFVLNLGVLLFEIGCFEKSLNYFQRSMQISGENPQALKNIAACHQKLHTRI